MIYGYVRVSTKEQNEDRQMIAMREFGAAKVYLDKQSGKDFNRPEYKKLVRKLKAGDVLVVQSLDRFGRNYDEIIEQWKLLTKDKQTDIVVLDMPLLDTRNDKNLTGRLIADIVLQLLAYVAQTEREFIRKRQREGIDAAMARGVKFGRERIEMPDGFPAAAEAWSKGLISGNAAAKQLHICTNTFMRRVREEGYPEPSKILYQRPVKQKRPIPEEFAACAEAWSKGKISMREAGKQLGVSGDTFRRWTQEAGVPGPAKSAGGRPKKKLTGPFVQKGAQEEKPESEPGPEPEKAGIKRPAKLKRFETCADRICVPRFGFYCCKDCKEPCELECKKDQQSCGAYYPELIMSKRS